MAIVLACAGIAVAQDAQRPETIFEEYAVVSQEGHASDVGAEALAQGGNAIDAAVATAFALAVTHPAAGNIGGGGFIVAYLADERRIVTVDFREAAPKASNETMYLDETGELVPEHRTGLRAGGVPGTVRGLALAHERFGSGAISWSDLVTPAVRLAREGFPISETLARSLNGQLRGTPGGADALLDGSGPDARLADFPASVAAFAKPDGTAWAAGDVLRQPDLAATLERIATQGPDDFYLGETARIIASAMAEHGGLITEEDLAAYQAKLREPVQTMFREYEVYGMGPPSSGGIVDILMLNILERFDLAGDGRDHPRTVHRITEAMRRAFHVRATELADPDFFDVPIERLTSKPFARDLRRSMTRRATPSEALADFPIAGLANEDPETTHLSTIDGEGNAVALTYTLEQGYGSKAVVPGTGFLLNNEMGDFNLIPGRTDARGRIGTEPNRIEPGKRMLSSMSPTIVLEGGRVRLVTGSPGGRTIPNTVIWVVLNVLEFGLDPRAAVDAPRTHHAWFPDVLSLEGDSWSVRTRNRLERRGHRLGRIAIQGDAHTIVVEPGTGKIHGVADPRRATSKASGR